MNLFKKVVYTVCSGDLEPGCDNKAQQKQLPEFKKNCPLCGSKTSQVLGPNPVALAAMALLLLASTAGAYWKVVQLRGAVTRIPQDPAGAKRQLAPPPPVNTPPAAPEALQRLQSMVAQNDYSGALRLGEELLRSHPTDPTLLNNCGAAAMKLGDIAKAQLYLEKVVGLRPNDPYFRYNLACLDALAGRKQQAVAHLRKACQLGLAPANFRQDPDLASLSGFGAFEDLVRNKTCQ